MGKKLFILTLAVALFAFASCIDYENTFTLNNSGSGTVHIHYWMTADVAGQLPKGEGGADPLSEAEITKKYSGEGLTVSNVKVREESTKKEDGTETKYKHVELDVSFTHITKLSNAPEFNLWTFEWNATEEKVAFKAVVKPGTQQNLTEGTNTYTAIFNFPGNILTYSENGKIDQAKPKQVVYAIDVFKMNRDGWTLTAESQLGSKKSCIAGNLVFVVLIVVGMVIAGDKKRLKEKN